MYKAADLNPVPPGAGITVYSDDLGKEYEGVSQEDFLSRWASFSFIAVYDGQSHRMTFDQSAVEGMLPKLDSPSPHVTPAKP
jgi:hypothetical protein